MELPKAIKQIEIHVSDSYESMIIIAARNPL
jgi:hypothetical protein